MTVIDFIRLLRKHLALLVLTPITLALLVLYFTQNPDYTYSSDTILYTGIASGSSVEMDKSLSFFATNTAFDNLINVIKSRETQQEVGIRLLAQHLMLNSYDPRYISKQSYLDLRRITPAHIKDIIITDLDANPVKTVADTSLIEERFSFDGLDTTSVIKMQPASINIAAFEQTVKNLKAYMGSSDTNFVYKLLYFNHPHYSINAISSINVQRIASSDLVKLKYNSDDPGICRQTLAIITEVCIQNYKQIKENRSDAVVKYFEFQLKQASGRLKVNEDKLLKFNEDNNIINYYEQSKAVAVVKEELDVEYNNKRIKLAGNQAAIKSIEEKLEKQQQVQLNSATILEKRNKLSLVNSKIATVETIAYGKKIDDEQLVALKTEAEKLKDEIRENLNELFTYGNSTNGLPVSKLLGDWITNVIEYEDTKAGIEVLGDRIKEFQKQYAIYAPAGANLKRIEREISVSEQEFLELLHGLNLAKLKVQDAELSSTIKAIDPPFFPLSPNPTKRKILVAFSALVGFILVLSVILATEYFDNTLKNTTRASQKLQLKIIGIFPKIFLNTGSLNFSFVINRLIEMIIQQIDLLTLKKANIDSPRTLLFFSTLSNEGKTVTAGNLALKLKEQGKKVLYINYSSESIRQIEINQNGYQIEPLTASSSKVSNVSKKSRILSWIFGLSNNRINTSSEFLKKPEEFLDNTEYHSYELNPDYFSTTNVEKLLINNNVNASYKPQYIIIELPAILFYSYPPELIKSVDLAILVCRANRVWTSADNNALEIIKKITLNEPVIILNGITPQVVESLLGDLPKKRSWLRRVFKNLVRLQFNSRYHP